MQGVWLRLDVPLVMSQLLAEAHPALLANISTTYALYTDVDVMFMPGHDHSTCTLPLPRLFNIGPEANKGTTSNTGKSLLSGSSPAVTSQGQAPLHPAASWKRLLSMCACCKCAWHGPYTQGGRAPTPSQNPGTTTGGLLHAV